MDFQVFVDLIKTSSDEDITSIIVGEGLVDEAFIIEKTDNKIIIKPNLEVLKKWKYFIVPNENGDDIYLQIELVVYKTIKPTYKYDYSNGIEIPKDFSNEIQNNAILTWIGNDFIKYIFYRLYGNYVEDIEEYYNKSSKERFQLKMQRIILAIFINAAALQENLQTEDSFVRFFRDDSIIYTIDKVGRTKAIIENLESDTDIFSNPNSFISLVTLPSLASEEYLRGSQKQDIFSIKDSGNDQVWKIYLDTKPSDTDSLTQSFSLGTSIE